MIIVLIWIQKVGERKRKTVFVQPINIVRDARKHSAGIVL